METPSVQDLTRPLNEQPSPQNSPEQSPVDSTNVSLPGDERVQIKALLADARRTRDVLVDGRAAIESGTYAGARMLPLAKFLAFVEAILAQNQSHIKALQDRLG